MSRRNELKMQGIKYTYGLLVGQVKVAQLAASLIAPQPR